MKKIVVALMSLIGTVAAEAVAKPTMGVLTSSVEKVSTGPRKRFKKISSCYYRSGGRCMAPAR
ncbi:MAG: hypothetical protein NZ580_06195 [Bacteroidia bacterium]|nr:hypothetical protein [Bacteroidia bacterium]MDW8236440.1 hypothetical protein [Bacteroidia bacterium]